MKNGARVSAGLLPGQAARLDPVCDRFEAAWRAGRRPPLEDFLSAVAEPDRPALLRELLHLDLRYRAWLGEQAAAADYQDRLPGYASLIASVVAGESTQPEVTLTPSGVSSIPGYEVLDELGRGGMGVVYKARDLQRNELVALKTVQGLNPENLYRFKREFRTLAGVTHRNLVALYDLISDGNVWFFTMELLDGVPFTAYARTTTVGDREADSNRDGLRGALRQLVEGVAALHAAGKLHRDVKPSNALVTREGRVVLLDFGLVAELDGDGHHRSTEQHVLGTVAYMAPEQAASQSLTPAADWYSVGVILYEALTGRHPFRGSVLQVLQDKQHQDPPPPQVLVPAAPADLNDLCVDLLRRDPTARPCGTEILARLGGVAGNRQRGDESATPRRPFVGRSPHLEALTSAFALMEQGCPVALDVRGRSGTGKSTLVRHFLEHLDGRPDVVILEGRCYQQESVPYKAFDGLVDALSRHWRRLAPDVAAGLLPRDIAPLARLFPVLNRVPAVAAAPRRGNEEVDPLLLRRQAFAALREVLARLGDRCRLVLFIDDLQWGDVDSARLLADLLKPPEAPALLLLASYRSEDADTSPCLRGLREGLTGIGEALTQRVVSVEPLAQAEATDLARQLLGRAGAEAEAVARESGGSPFFILELVAHAQTEAGSAAAGLALDEVLWSRMGQLSEETRRLLEVVAVAGRPLAATDVCAAAGLAAVPRQVLLQLQSGRLLVSSGPPESEIWNCYHDRVRESVLRHLAECERHERHRRLAETLEASAGPDAATVRMVFPARAAVGRDLQRICDIAFHFDAAGEPERGLPFALTAADQARAQGSLESAERQYRIAERGAHRAVVAVRFRAVEGLGDVLMLAGRYAEAAERFAAAQALAQTDEERAWTTCKLGEVAFKQGDVQGGAEAAEQALALLGHGVPRRRLTCRLWVAWERLVQRLHKLLPSWFLARRPLENAGTNLLLVRIYNRLCYTYWFGRGTEPALWAHFRGLNLVERYPPTPELAYLYATHGVAMTLLGSYDAGIAAVEKSLALRRQFHDTWGEGQSFNFYGIVLYAAARYEEAVDRARASTRLLEQAGDPWEANLARYHASVALYRLGRLPEAATEAERIYQRAQDLGDVQLVRFSLDVWSKATYGEVPQGLLEPALQLPRDDIQAAGQAYQAWGVWLLRQGRPAEAVEVFQKIHDRSSMAGLCNLHTVPARAWLATALRKAAAQIEEVHPLQAVKLRKRAVAHATRALRLARRFPCDRPHVLRELGLLLAARGRTEQALQRLNESVAVAEQQRAAYECAQTQLVRGLLGQRLDLPGAAEQATAARAALRSLGAGENVELLLC